MGKNEGKGKERREMERVLKDPFAKSSTERTEMEKVLKDPIAKSATNDLIALIDELTRGGGVVLNATVAILDRNCDIHIIGDPEFVSEFQDSIKR